MQWIFIGLKNYWLTSSRQNIEGKISGEKRFKEIKKIWKKPLRIWDIEENSNAETVFK
jgi:hypothetical protein